MGGETQRDNKDANILKTDIQEKVKKVSFGAGQESEKLSCFS